MTFRRSQVLRIIACWWSAAISDNRKPLSWLYTTQTSTMWSLNFVKIMKKTVPVSKDKYERTWNLTRRKSPPSEERHNTDRAAKCTTFTRKRWYAIRIVSKRKPHWWNTTTARNDHTGKHRLFSDMTIRKWPEFSLHTRKNLLQSPHSNPSRQLFRTIRIATNKTQQHSVPRRICCRSSCTIKSPGRGHGEGWALPLLATNALNFVKK